MRSKLELNIEADGGLCLANSSGPLAELTWLGGKALVPTDSCDSGSEGAKRLGGKLAVVPKEILEAVLAVTGGRETEGLPL